MDKLETSKKDWSTLIKKIIKYVVVYKKRVDIKNANRRINWKKYTLTDLYKCLII